jgi:N-acetylmuramoyl-L-alanine amidase
MSNTHIASDGDSVISIAARFGYSPEALWQHPANAALRAQRTDGNVLHVGDLVHLPPPVSKTLTVESGQRHRFRRRGVPAKFRIQLLAGDHPRAGEAWRLEVDSQHVASGVTDARGVLEAWLPPNARQGVLTVGPDNEVLRLAFGRLDPADCTSGIQQRLGNLGYPHGAVTGSMDRATQRALEIFAAEQGVESAGAEAALEHLGRLHDRLTQLPSRPAGGQ